LLPIALDSGFLNSIQMKLNRILIFGAGVIGSIYAGKLALSGPFKRCFTNSGKQRI
jgi:prephenate dehydrogenase